MRKCILLTLLLLFTLLIRVYKISEVPAGLSYDEIDYGYHAKSLIQTGKDYRGEQSLFFVHSFNDIRTPIPAYFTVLTSYIFNTPHLQIRGPSVILGILNVVLFFYLIFLWTKNFYASLISSFVFSANPWQIQYSRFSHEGASLVFFYLLAMVLFTKAVSTKRFRYFLGYTIILSLSLYTYRTMSLFAPLTFLLLFLIYSKDHFRLGVKKGLILLFTASVVIGSFLYATTIGAPDLPRINQLALSSDPEIAVWVQRNREVDSGDLIDASLGKKAAWSSYIFHSKPLSILSNFLNNYFYTFSTTFLFTTGDRNIRQSVGGMGELFFIDIFGLVSGLAYIVIKLRSDKNFLWLLVWFLVSPIPASLTLDGAGHASRLLTFSIPLLMIVGLGWWRLLRGFKETVWKKAGVSGLAFIWVISFIFYLHRYFVHYPIEAARSFGYGFEQAMKRIIEVEKKYEKIKLSTAIDPPIPYYLYWSNTNLQKLNAEKITELNWSNEDWDKLNPKTLYLLTQNEVGNSLTNIGGISKEIDIIDTIKYPDNQPAFYLISRKE